MSSVCRCPNRLLGTYESTVVLLFLLLPVVLFQQIDRDTVMFLM